MKEQLDATAAQLSQNQAQLEATAAQLAQSKAQLDAAGAALDDTERQLTQAREKLEESARQLAAAKAQLEETGPKLESARQELEDGERELSDHEGELDDARQKLEDLKEPDTYVLGRDTNVGYVCFESDTNIVAGVSRVFPLFFFLLAALVCITTMTRMVEEQRTQLGVLMAMGYAGGHPVQVLLLLRQRFAAGVRPSALWEAPTSFPRSSGTPITSCTASGSPLNLCWMGSWRPSP